LKKFGIAISITFLFAFFSYNRMSQINKGHKDDSILRSLDNTDKYKEICEKANQELYDHYFKEIDDKYDTTFETEDTAGSQILIDFITDASGENLIEYVKDSIKWLIFIACGILAIIGWIICCCCTCCNCCCFKTKCQNSLCSFITFVLCAACYGTVAILGIYTAAKANNAITGINNASCSLFGFIEDIKNGQKKTKSYSLERV
jgi:archaellin